jgi:anti-sigma-K factor RskA
MAAGPIDHDALRELAPSYVLGTLAASERAAFEAHLATCAECTAEVRSLAPVVGALAHTVSQIEPPPALRARVIQSVAGDGSRREISPRPVPDVRRYGLAWLAAAACVIAAVLLGAYAVSLRGRVNNVQAVLSAPDLMRIDLAGQTVAPSAAARAFWSRSRGLVFTATNLPALPMGRIYQLWVLSAQPAPISAGLFRPDRTGSVNEIINTPPDLPRPTAMAVTIEPEQGVPAPTGEKYLVGLAN